MTTFLDIAKPNNWPTSFRVLVIADTVRERDAEWDPKLGLRVTPLKTMYVAVALEWYLVSQGETIEQAVDALEHQLMTQAAIKIQFPDSKDPDPAPEDYQRVATSGDWYICTHTLWKALLGRKRIARRCVIDMAASKLRLAPKT